LYWFVTTLITSVLISWWMSDMAAAEVLSSRVKYFGYDDCIELKNETTRVVLGHHAGGRVLEYSLNGTNAILLDPEQAGWVWDGKTRIGPTGGRFDIGPENLIPKRNALWLGPWGAEILGPGKARMTSVRDEATGTQLIRDFELDDNSSRLSVAQTITNISDDVTRWCHWSRTFSTGHGICVVPIDDRTKFPEGYIMYGPGRVMDYRPGDPSIIRDGEYLVVRDTPLRPKLGMDSYVGWFAYLTTDDLLFVKQYPTFPDRVYNEMAGLTISIWYKEDQMCELEPIGPMEELNPGESASFTETWTLAPHDFPEDRTVDPREIGKIVEALGQVGK
jgi:hypothetical protein